MYRNTVDGGLSVHNVKIRAMALLIHNFLAQAICPRYKPNMYYNTLYRWHVLGQRDIPNPGCPPFYSTCFFSIIRDTHENTPLNIAWVTVKQWYRLLMEKGITHSSEEPSVPAALIASKLETKHLDANWPNAYQLARKFGLSPEQKSFLFKMLQSLLPTRERLARVGKAPSSACTFCQDPDDNIAHLMTCTQGVEVTTPLRRCLEVHTGTLSSQDVVLLNFTTTESMELPLVWLIFSCSMLVWYERSAGRIARLVSCIADLKAMLLVLKHTKQKHATLHNFCRRN